MHAHGAAAAPVSDQSGQLVGHTVGELMQTPVVSLTPGASLHDVEAQLIENGAPLGLITDGRCVLGTVSPRELAAAVRRHGQTERPAPFPPAA